MFTLRKSLLAIVLAACAGASAGCSSSLETITIELGGRPFEVEIARTPAEQRKGLMHRRSLAENRGMLFPYDHDRRLSFWMKDTLIPLSIAFVAADGTIKEIYDMKPGSLNTITSQHSVRYALEVNQGAFERIGVRPGDRVVFPEGFR